MLVLSRFEDESIVINGNIVITVLQICGAKVRLGISAPDDVKIHRFEVQRRIDAGEPKPSRRDEPRDGPHG